MSQGKITIATCQFAVGSSIRRNGAMIRQFMQQAKRGRADIVHFSECALSGYAGADIESTGTIDWGLLRQETEQILALAEKLRLWVVLGSTHRLTGLHKPHNCLYLISPAGKIVNRYDKRFCMERDMAHYSPGNHFVFFTINGVKCSLLICFDVRFPELYRELRKQKVDCIFQSFHNARQSGRTVHTDIMRQSMQCRAATDYFWVSMANSSAYYSAYPSCFIQPDGKILQQLRFHQAGIMFNTVDLRQRFYDPMAPYRKLAMSGHLSNGPKLRDGRSRSRTIL